MVGRALDDVAGQDRSPGVLAGVGIDEVEAPVVGAEDHLGDPIGPLPEHGLPGPSVAAPAAGGAEVGGCEHIGASG